MNKRVYIKKTKINVPVERLFSWHENDGAILRLTPPWAPLKMMGRKGQGLKKGVSVTFEIRIFNIPMIWESEHIAYEKNSFFKDRQIKGPFSKWEHTHSFIRDGKCRSIMEDKVEFTLPFGIFSRPFYAVAKKEIDRMFRYRHQVLKYDLARHVNAGPKKRILISGASGTIGSVLAPFLKTCGHDVIRLVRIGTNLRNDEIFWDPDKGILDLKWAGPVDAVINLNGLDIARKRWTMAQKKKIMDSRVCATRLLVNRMKTLSRKPEVFISSSAIGYYGNTRQAKITEKNPKGSLFISHVCDQWEKASLEAEISGIRTVQIRIGIVLTPAGGALKRMLLPFRAGCGVILSNGRQYMSWISMEDTISGILHILNSKKIQGPVNLTSPQPVTNKVFSQKLARVFEKRAWFRLPAAVIRALWGQMGEETLLAGTRAMPDKLLKTGFSFQHQSIDHALKDMLGRS